MAELTEKQQLLKEIKHLSDLISHAKQRDVDHMQRCSGSKPIISGNMKKQQQQPGSSEPTSFSASVLSAFSSSAEAQTPAAVDSAAAQVSGGKMSQKAHLVPVQQQAISQSLKRNTSQIEPQLQKGNTSQIHSPCKDVNTSACTEQCTDKRKGIIHRRIIVSKLDPTVPLLCSGNGTKSATQNYGKREALKEYATMLAKYISAQVVPPLPSVKIRKHTASSLPGKVLSQVPSITKVQQNHCVSGQKAPTNQPHPVQPTGGSKSMNSLRKSKVFSKNAEVMAAREAMQKEIEDMKSKLANIAAAKKSRITKNAVNKCEMQKDKAFSEGKIQSCHMKEVGEKIHVSGITGSPKLENVAVYGSPVKGSKQEPAMNGHLPVSSQPASPHRTFKAEQGKSEKEDAIIIEKQSNNCSKFPPVASDAELLYPLSCASTEMENMTPVEIFRKSPCSSPSRSAAKANLEKELKATEEKLQDMRKKMGVILKDAPQNSDLNVKGGREPSPRHQQAVFNASSCAQAIITHVSSSRANQRLFPHRASLKWTPKKFPRKKSSEHVLVIGSSPNMRTLSLSSATASLSKQTVRVCGRNVTPVNTNGKKQTPRRRKSQHCIVRNDSVLVGDKSRNSASSTSVREVQKPLNSVSSSSAFVSRYKVQRVSSGSKRDTLAPSSQQKTVVQSRFKLMKFVSRDSPHSPTNTPGMSPLLSAKQRAAQIIKSKYKLKREFLPSPHGYSTLQMNQYLKPRHLTARNGFNHSPSTFGRHNHFSYNNGYRLSHSFLPTGAGRGRGVFKQRRTGLTHFQTVRWKGGFFMGTSPAEWGIQMSPLLQSKCQRVWKRKGKKGQTPYDQLAQCVQMKRTQRLYWKNIHSLSRKQASHQFFISQKKRNLNARCERLVMINGTVYKSSSRRLIKACSVSSPSTKSGAAATSALLNMPAGTRGEKRLGMKMVMVRGACFKVDARGTRLQRVINSAKKGKKAAVSGGADENVMSSVRTRYVINRVKQRSIFVAAAAKSRKKEGKSTKKHCLYFSRFGKCSRGDACPFLHDPARIAVCTRFLRGTCQVENCPFSHKVSKEKMPVCAFFLKGVCTRDACPYLHVKVNQGAEICQDFISGFCPLAEKCPKLHTLTCPHYAKTGVCPDGKKCRLVHRKSRGAKRHRVKTSSSSTHSSSTPRDRSSKNRKRPVESSTVEETWQHAKEVEGGAPSSKYFRSNSGRQSKQEVQNCGSFLTLLGSQTASVEAEGTRSADSGHSRSIEPGEGDVGTSSQGQLPKLPAFISLADYSFEESPVVQGRVNRSRKSAEHRNGPNLKIKPRF